MLRRYALPYLHWYVAGTLLLLVTNFLAVHIPLLLAVGVDALSAGDRDAVGPVAQEAMLMAVGVLVVRTLSRLMFFTPGRLVEARVKADLMAALVRHQPVFVRRFPPAEVVSRAANDVNQIRLVTGFAALQLVNSLIAVVMVLGQMGRVAPNLAAWVLLPISLGLVATGFSVRRIFVLIRAMQEALAALSDHVLTSFQGISTVQSFTAEPGFLARFDERNAAVYDASIRRANIRAFMGPLLGTAGAAGVFLLVYVGGPMAMRGEVTVGQLVAFTTLVAFLVEPLRSVSFLVAIAKEAQAAMQRAGEILDPPPDRPERPGGLPAPVRPPAIVVRGLEFRWPGADAAALSGVDLDIAPGATLGVVGPTGAGKSTLLQVLARLYNPPPGAVLIDGNDIRTIDLDDWRRALTLVPQRALLFSDTLADNVLLGGADPSRLEGALEDAAFRQDLTALPAGTATRVGEDGVVLSGGQRQRVSLARAWARDPVVLLLDDVLSAVDHATEKQLVRTMARRKAAGQPVTTVIVAHRLTAIQHADEIVVIENGRVSARGTHDELVAKPGFYRDTWLRQREAPDA
jgi:ATP-binding cassette subfamily B protein